MGDGLEDWAARESVLQQVRELTEDYQQLVQSVVRSEKRFRGLAKAVWRIQEEERRRLARELHDGIGQTLTALHNQLQRIQDDAEDNPGLRKRIGSALEITKTALHDTRELSRLLRPTVLDDLGLESALGWLARMLQERAGLEVVVNTRLEGRRLSPDIETLVFRIAQEALTNVIRHSGVATAELTLSCIGSLLRLTVRDEGKGFDADARQHYGAASAGLRGMRDRAELFGGRLDIISTPGKGAMVKLVLPLDSDSSQPSDIGSDAA